MAADPTSKVRRAVGEKLPGALGQSLAEDYKKEDEQLAIDEANNLVEQRAPSQLPQEAAAFVNPEIPVEQSVSTNQAAFVNPSAPAQVTQREVATVQPGMSQLAPEVQAPSMPSADGAIDAYAKEAAGINDQMAKVQEARTLEIQKRLEEDEKAIEQVDPKDYFEGKSTWQKVLGGIGMFLGSITPEGAKNVASIIEKEINRDIEAQKTNIKLRQDKKDSRFKLLIDKYGSEEAALLAKKKGAFDLMDLQMKKLELQSRNAETRAKIAMGREELNLKRQELGVKLQSEMMKQQKEFSKGAVPGYQGTIQDEKAARDFRGQLASAKSAYSEIDNLLKINNQSGASLSPSLRASAGQSQALLLGQLREILVGPGSMSEGDRSLMEDAIANPTSFFSLKSSNKIKLDKLKQSIQRKLDANASAYGLSRGTPAGARKIQ